MIKKTVLKNKIKDWFKKLHNQEDKCEFSSRVGILTMNNGGQENVRNSGYQRTDIFE